MKDLNEVVSQKIDDLHNEIGDRYRQLEETVVEFRQFTSRSDAYDIVTFLPGKIREIEWQRRRIEELEAQARMLVWMEREVEI
jgi:hypothetical protein